MTTVAALKFDILEAVGRSADRYREDTAWDEHHRQLLKTEIEAIAVALGLDPTCYATKQELRNGVWLALDRHHRVGATHFDHADLRAIRDAITGGEPAP